MGEQRKKAKVTCVCHCWSQGCPVRAPSHACSWGNFCHSCHGVARELEAQRTEVGREGWFLRLLTGVPRPLLQAGLENSPQSSLPLCSHGLRDGGKHTVSSAFCSLLLFAFRRPETPAAWIPPVRYLKPWDNRQRSPVENRQERGQTTEPWGTPTLSHWQDEEGQGKKGKNRLLWYAGYQVKKVTQRTGNHGRIPKLLTSQLRYLSENKSWP